VKIIRIHEFNFDQVTDPVATEEYVYTGLVDHIDSLPEDLNYVCLPLAYLINTKDIPFTQDVLDRIEKKVPGVKKYVCQHIYVKDLNFYNNIVYTPHCLMEDNLRVIPHYNPCINKKDFIPFSNRKYDFSFIGAFKTHSLRSRLLDFHNNDNIIVEDTDTWHFEKNIKDRNKFKQRYKDVLLNSKFALCPPGTGVSTIRLYEAMAAGSVPVIFNSVKIPRCVEHLVIRLKSISHIKNIAKEACKLRHEELHNRYWRNLSNDNIFSIII
jgi:hypothetical protein